MKKTPERIEALAAEYVLGSLHGAARRRFERWMMESVRVRQEVWFWEEKLGHLGARIEEEQPPASVWAGIERRLWAREDKPESAVAANDASGRWFWPGWSMLATAAALVLAVVLVQQPEPEMDDRLSGAIVQADVSVPLPRRRPSRARITNCGSCRRMASPCRSGLFRWVEPIR